MSSEPHHALSENHAQQRKRRRVVDQSRAQERDGLSGQWEAGMDETHALLIVGALAVCTRALGGPPWGPEGRKEKPRRAGARQAVIRLREGVPRLRHREMVVDHCSPGTSQLTTRKCLGVPMVVDNYYRKP